MKTVDSGTGRRKPVRPAPPAPTKKNSQTPQEQPPAASPCQPEVVQTVPPPTVGSGGPPSGATSNVAEVPALTASSRDVSKEDLFGTLTSNNQYLDLDLDVTEDEPTKSHSRAGSDALVMLHENSTSLPEFPSIPMDRDLSSPESRGGGGEGGGRQTSPDSEVQCDVAGGVALEPGSFLGSLGKDRGHKKRSSKRGGSVKVRSRSPPNLPPPPPPPLSNMVESQPPADKPQSSLESSFPLTVANLPPPPPFYSPSAARVPSEPLPPLPLTSNGKGCPDLPSISATTTTTQQSLKGEDKVTNLEFLDVMNTISTIEQQLNEMEIQSPIRSKDSVTFRPIAAGPIDALASPQSSDGAGQDPSAAHHSGNILYDHLHGNNFLYDHLDGDGSGGTSSSAHDSPPPAVAAVESSSSSGTKVRGQGGSGARLRSSSSDNEEELIVKNLSPKKSVSKQITKRIFFPDEQQQQGAPPPPLKDLTPKVENRDFPPKPSNKKNQRVTFKAEVIAVPSELTTTTSSVPFELEAVPTARSLGAEAPGVAPAKIANIKKMLFGESELAVHRYKKECVFEACQEQQGGATGGDNQKVDNNNTDNVYEIPWEKKPVAKYTPEFRKYENVAVAERFTGAAAGRSVQVPRSSITGEMQPVQLPNAASMEGNHPHERQINGGAPASPGSCSGAQTDAGVSGGRALNSPQAQSGSVLNGTSTSYPQSFEAQGKGNVSATTDNVVPLQNSPRSQRNYNSLQKHPKDKAGRKVEFALPDSEAQSSAAQENSYTSFEPAQSYVYRSLV